MDVTLTWLLTAAIVVIRWCSATSSIPGNSYLDRYQPSLDRYNYFDTELLQVLCREEQGNVVISPLSVKLVLEMLMEGAGGKSAEEIEAALRLSNSNEAVRQELQQRLFSIQRGTNPDDVRIASQLFVSLNFRINRDYVSLLMKHYDSNVLQMRFRYPRETAEILNSWVSNATSGKINKLADESQISDNAKLILASAIYFKGTWKTPFSTEKTVTKCFYVWPEKCVQVPLMTESGSYDFGYIDKLDAYTINLPYEDGRFSMILVLPNKRNGLLQLTRDIIHVSLHDIIAHMGKEHIRVEIPRFTAEYNRDLVHDLEKLHISQVFGNSANLSGISFSEKASVTNFFHSAKIEVDEQGTVAAASTGVLFLPLIGGSTRYFIADHPFLFFIRDAWTGTVLFSGKIERPQEVQSDVKSRQSSGLANQGDLRKASSINLFSKQTNHSPKVSDQGILIQSFEAQANQNYLQWQNRPNQMPHRPSVLKYSDAIRFNNPNSGRGYFQQYN